MDPSAAPQPRQRATDHEPARPFPGGSVRLPYLGRRKPDEQPAIRLVDSAFAPLDSDEPAEPVSGFAGYFTTESLFAEPEAPSSDLNPEDPYLVLRVAPSDEWVHVTMAYRALVKEFHPDRFVNHPPAVIDSAESEIRRINMAYSQLRQIHPGAS